MTTQEAIEVLKDFNAWRRGEGEYAWSEIPAENKPCPHDPREIGIAIDVAINALKGKSV